MLASEVDKFKPRKGETQMESIERAYGKDFGTKDPEKVFDYFEKAGWPGFAKFLRGNNVKK